MTKLSLAFFTPTLSKTSKRLITSAALLGSAMGVSQYAQAASYYNCANATGCVPVSGIYVKSDFTKTKFPVVLAHGLGGWTKLLGLMDYFHGIPQDLTSNGASVYATKVSSLNDTEVRGEQLLQQVKTIAAITGSQKVNLIGHSHGGIDVRYVAAVAPEVVASATAVSSPEQGSKMADWVVKMITEGSAAEGKDVSQGEFNLSSRMVMAFFNMVGMGMDVGSGISPTQLQEQDSWAAVNSLTSKYAMDFNRKYPAAMPTTYCGMPTDNFVNGVRYYSFSGVSTVTSAIDPSDTMLSLTALPFGSDTNDGLVSKCSSRLGYVVRDDYLMNHLDSVNQVLGLTSIFETNPMTLYRKHVNLLKNQQL